MIRVTVARSTIVRSMACSQAARIERNVLKPPASCRMGGAQAGAWRLETGIVLEAGYGLDVMKWMGA